MDGNGIQDSGEEAFSGVDVTLQLADGTVVDSTTTDSSGRYSFTDLTPGSYRISFSSPAGYSLTLADQGGDDGKDSDAGVDGRTVIFILSSGENVISNRSVQGVGAVSAAKTVRSSQGSYEWGTGSYRIEEQMESGSNYMAKDIQVVFASVNFSYTPRYNVSQSMKWQEGMYTRSSDAALRGGSL